MSAAWRLSNRLSARVMRYHGSRQIASNRLEPSASYRYFDWSCFGSRARSRRTSAANSAVKLEVMIMIPIGLGIRDSGSSDADPGSRIPDPGYPTVLNPA